MWFLKFGLIILFFFVSRKHAATACQDRNVRYELNIELKIMIWARLFEGRLALNPGLNLTRVSFCCV